jgi:hypothetical protein
MLDAAYITECEQRARRFSGAYTGTAGSLAAATLHLIKERRELMATLEEANQALRDAVSERLAGTPSDDPKMIGWNPDQESCCEGGKCNPAQADEIPSDWILRGEEELKRERMSVQLKPAATVVHPTSQAFFDRLQQIKNLHVEKTSQYGAPDDPFANVTASEKCGVEPWRRALCDASDCIVRLQRYAHGQPVDFDNAVMDGINWLLICWLKHDEARK